MKEIYVEQNSEVIKQLLKEIFDKASVEDGYYQGIDLTTEYKLLVALAKNDKYVQRRWVDFDNTPVIPYVSDRGDYMVIVKYNFCDDTKSVERMYIII